jgi:hypothetical protein
MTEKPPIKKKCTIETRDDVEAYFDEKKLWDADDWATFYGWRWSTEQRNIKGYAAAWERLQSGESDESLFKAAKGGDLVAHIALQILCRSDGLNGTAFSTIRAEFSSWAMANPVTTKKLRTPATKPDLEARARAVGQAVEWVRQKTGAPVYPIRAKPGEVKPSVIEAVAKGFGLSKDTVEGDYKKWVKLKAISTVESN